MVATGGACMVTPGGACVVAPGGCAWLLPGGCAWLLPGGMSGIRRDTEIRPISGRYASYWNAFLYFNLFTLKKMESLYAALFHNHALGEQV